MNHNSFDMIGTSPARIDAAKKVTGTAQYAGDFKPAGMCYAKILTSPYASAEILSIDTSKAEKLPGVIYVMTGKDVPEQRYGDYMLDRHILCKKLVRYVGDFVACVVALTEDIAWAGCNLIDVEYKVLPHVIDETEAYKKDAVLVHPDVESYGPFMVPDEGVTGLDDERKNSFGSIHVGNGGSIEALKDADVIVENTFRLPRASHCTMEPHSCVCVPDVDGGMTIYASEQAYAFCKDSICDVLGIGPSKLHFFTPYLGGGFGGKTGIQITKIAALAAKNCGRPVSLIQTREENFVSGIPRSSGTVYIKDGYSKDGKLLARNMELIINGGGYACEAAVAMGSVKGALGNYYCPHLDVTAHDVYTHTGPTGPYRGLGAEFTVFAIERNMDIAAKKLGLTPVEIRRINALRDGDIDGLGQVNHSLGSLESLEKVAEKLNLSERRPPEGPWVFGKGLALGNKFTNFGMTHTGSICKIYEDGCIELRTSHVEMGQGGHTVDAMCAAEVFHCDLSKVKVTYCDSFNTPYDMGTFCSRGTFLHGNASILSARDAKSKLLKIASEKMGIPADKLETENGEIYEIANPENRVPFMACFNWGGYVDETSELLGIANYAHPLAWENPDHAYIVFYSYGAWGIEVAVNTETGEVRLLNLDGCYDGGKILNMNAARAQIDGSFSMGYGQAVFEEEQFNADGRVINPSFRDYRIPTFLDGPRNKDLRFSFVDSVQEDGPFGAKGLGEVGMVPVMPAVANAINDAVGVDLNDLPITRERVLAALNSKKAAEMNNI